MKPRQHSPTPYLETWLRRTRRQLAASGRMTQVAAVLAARDGVAPAGWEQTLRSILDGRISPGIELLTRIEAVLSAPAHAGSAPAPSRPASSAGDQLEFIRADHPPVSVLASKARKTAGGT